MVDHHTVARQFMLHEEGEMKTGRTTHARLELDCPSLIRINNAGFGAASE
jgi:nitric oxide synthase oxygenase domain/subunit